MNTPRQARPPLIQFRLLAALVAVLAVAVTGCASLQKPQWPWSKTASSDTEKEIDRQLGEDAESEVISSEYTPSSDDAGWDYFKGENIKKRWKKVVGRGPNEKVARAALAEADTLFRDGKYKEAIKK